jgi:PleD family two-component response regulator
VNHVVGFTEMLQEDAASRGWQALLPDLERVRQAGRDLAEVVDGVDVDRLEAGSLDAAALGVALRTPLDSIVGFSQLLQEDAQERGCDGALPDLAKVEAAAKHLTSLIDAVLELVCFYAASPAAGQSAVAASPPPASARPTAGSILLADDNQLDAEMLERRLRQLGFAVRVASSGRAALACAQAERFDLLLLDVLMPELDGLETLRQLKAQPAGRDTPVLMISAMEEIPIVARCIQLGADDYLSKPVEPILLKAKIEAALERRRLRQAEARLSRELASALRRLDEQQLLAQRAGRG